MIMMDGKRTYFDEVDECITNTACRLDLRQTRSSDGNILAVVGEVCSTVSMIHDLRVRSLTNAKIHEVVAAVTGHVEDALQLGLSDTVGNVAKHDLKQCEMRKHERVRGTYRGADIKTTSDALDIDASVLTWSASATRAIVADKIATELVVAGIGWNHGATGEADLLSSGRADGDHAVDFGDSRSNRSSRSLNTREEWLSFDAEELLWSAMVNGEG
jgi:hypothetical protein